MKNVTSFFIDKIENLKLDTKVAINIDSGLVLSRFLGHTQLEQDINLDNVVKISNGYCRKNNPLCQECPLSLFCDYGRKYLSKLEDEKDTIPFIDLFCGAGGLSIGLEAYNFRPIYALDHNQFACETYLFNRPFLSETNVQTKDIIEIVDNGLIPKAPVIVGGPPCQGFSNANRQRLADDPRNYLYKYFIKSVEQSGASICIVENVPGMLSAKNAVENDFKSIGFLIKPFTLNAKDLGYPQNRNRVFWLGIKTDDGSFYSEVSDYFESLLLKSETNKLFTLFDAIFDLPGLEAKTVRNATHLENQKWGFTIAEPRNFVSEYSDLINGTRKKSFLFNHRTKYNNQRDTEIYSRLSPGEKSDAESIQDINPYKNRDGIFKDKFYKLEQDKPCKTITAHMYYDCHMYIHPTQARGLTPREAARVQGFPDDYFFLGSPNEWYRQIGNAVSPLVAKQVGKALHGVLNKYRNDLI